MFREPLIQHSMCSTAQPWWELDPDLAVPTPCSPRRIREQQEGDAGTILASSIGALSHKTQAVNASQPTESSCMCMCSCVHVCMCMSMCSCMSMIKRSRSETCSVRAAERTLSRPQRLAKRQAKALHLSFSVRIIFLSNLRSTTASAHIYLIPDPFSLFTRWQGM